MLEDLAPDDPRQIGPYQLLQRLGSGGMGRVFLGRSMGGRLVAVKVIHAELAADRQFRARFRQELAAARKVSGIFTAPVVDGDVDGPIPWLTTAYVRGPSLGEAVTADGPLTADAVLSLAAGLAEGLSAIHAAGVIHRDLKPSNVLLAEDGPRVIDFGISRAVDASALTGTGLVVGSPGFMSPEQAEGEAVGPATDVFSLGAVLVYAASADGPFGSGSAAALLYRVVHSEPRLGGLSPEVRSLAARCLAKDAAERPSTAEILAELNPAWQHAELSHSRTEPALPELSSPSLSSSERGDSYTGLTTRTSASLARSRPTAAPLRRTTPGISRPLALPRVPAAGRRRSRKLIRVAGPLAAVAVLLVAVFLIQHIFMPHPITITDPSSNAFIDSVAFSPDGKLIVTGDGTGSAYLWNASSHQLAASITDPSSAGINAVAFSPDGKLIIAGDGSGSAYLWNASSHQLAASITDPSSAGINAVAFSPDGKLIVTADGNGSAYLWNASSYTRIVSLADGASDNSPSFPGGVTSVAFSPDGEFVLTGDGNDSAYLWNTSSRTLAATLADPRIQNPSNIPEILSVAFSADGKLMATGDANGQAYLWSRASHALIASITCAGSVESLAFNPDGMTIACGGGGSADLWNTITHDQSATLQAPTAADPYAPVAFSPDDKTFITAAGSSANIYTIRK